MAEGSSNGQGNRPSRQPKDLQGLLNFCVENTKSEDAPSSAHREMSPERKEWLSQVIDEMTGDPIQEVKEHIRTVGIFLGSQHPTDQARSNALDSLDELFDWCESLDMAIDFVKIGGFAILHELITHSDSEFRRQGFHLVGVLVQNNPMCQEAVIKAELLPTMLNVLNAEQIPEVQNQAVHAISCLVRDSNLEAAQLQFVAHKGFEVLKKVLLSPGLFKCVVKIAFFLETMCQKDPQYKDAVCEAGIMELLVQELKGEHEQMHEQVMSALLSIARDHAPTQRVLARPDLNMAPFLTQRIELLTDKPENEEERHYAEELLQVIQSSDSS